MMKKIIVALILLVVILQSEVKAQATDSLDNSQMEQVQWNLNHAVRVYQTALSLQDLEAAKNALLDIMVEVPQNDSLMFEMGSIYFQLQNYRPSAILAREVLKTNPNNLGALELAGASYENLGMSDLALESFEKIYLQTDDFNALYKMVLLQFELAKYQQANTNLDILIGRQESEDSMVPLPTDSGEQKEYPVRVLFYNMKGMVQQELGNTEEARKNFQEALKLAPDFSSAKEYLESLDN